MNRSLSRSILMGVLALALLNGCAEEQIFGKKKKPHLPGERLSVLQLQKTLEPQAASDDAQGVSIPEPWVNEFWPQAGGYANHAMQNLAFNPRTPELAWKASIGEGAKRKLPLTAQPIVVANVIYAVDRELTLSAFDTQDGKRLWQSELAPTAEHEPVIGGGIAFGGNLLYATNGYNEAMAVSPADGKIVWRVKIPAPSRAAPSFSKGRVFVTTMDNRLLALSAETGETLWDYTGFAETAGLLGGASAAVTDEIVVPAFSSGELYALAVENGSVSWSENLAGSRYAGGLSSIPDITGLPIIDKGLVIAVNFGGRMIAIDERTGQRVWQRDISSDKTPWVAGNHVFVLTLDSELVALSRKDGSILWVSPLRKNVKASDPDSDPTYWTGPVLAGSRLILASNDGNVVEIDPRNGKIMRQWKTDYEFSLPLVVANKALYMLADDGTLLAYR